MDNCSLEIRRDAHDGKIWCLLFRIDGALRIMTAASECDGVEIRADGRVVARVPHYAPDTLIVHHACEVMARIHPPVRRGPSPLEVADPDAAKHGREPVTHATI